MKTDELRQRFLQFFQKKGHTVVPSDSLVPTLDPTLLFTGAGMNQFKDMLLCKGKLEFTRAACTPASTRRTRSPLRYGIRPLAFPPTKSSVLERRKTSGPLTPPPWAPMAPVAQAQRFSMTRGRRRAADARTASPTAHTVSGS